jgi:ribosomal protein S18 acetylase RimI-like enzyme
MSHVFRLETDVIECVKLTTEWAKPLAGFMDDLETHADSYFFAPHSKSESHIRELCVRQQRDIGYLLVSGRKVTGYGLLRGWDEGFETPSLGIAIHPTARGRGLGELLMHFLHVAAMARGAVRVRLRVRANNSVAIGLYTKLGYVFERDVTADGYLTGFKNLARDSWHEV